MPTNHLLLIIALHSNKNLTLPAQEAYMHGVPFYFIDSLEPELRRNKASRFSSIVIKNFIGISGINQCKVALVGRNGCILYKHYGNGFYSNHWNGPLSRLNERNEKNPLTASIEVAELVSKDLERQNCTITVVDEELLTHGSQHPLLEPWYREFGTALPVPLSVFDFTFSNPGIQLITLDKENNPVHLLRDRDKSF